MLPHDRSQICSQQHQHPGEIATVTEDCLKMQFSSNFYRHCGQPAPLSTAYSGPSWLHSTASSQGRWHPTAWRSYSPCSRKQQYTEDPFQHSRCLRVPETSTDPSKDEESSSNPAVRAAPLALLMFVPTSLTTDLPSMLHSILQRDRGITPTSSRSCRRLGPLLPNALTGNSELNIYFP